MLWAPKSHFTKFHSGKTDSVIPPLARKQFNPWTVRSQAGLPGICVQSSYPQHIATRWPNVWNMLSMFRYVACVWPGLTRALFSDNVTARARGQKCHCNVIFCLEVTSKIIIFSVLCWESLGLPRCAESRELFGKFQFICGTAERYFKWRSLKERVCVRCSRL